MAKELNELSIAAGQVINAFVDVFADRKFNPLEFQKLIGPLFSSIAAGQDAGLIIPELQTISNVDKENSVNVFNGELRALSEDDQEDVTGIYDGVLSVARILIRNAYQKGLEDGKNIATKAVKS